MQFFKKAVKPIKGLTEEQLLEAFDMYEDSLVKEIIEELEEEFEVDVAPLGNIIKRILVNGMTVGMKIAQEPHIVTDFYIEAKQLKVDNRQGVLDKTTGIFYDCRFGDHWVTVQGVLEDHYSYYYEAFVEMNYNNSDQYKDVTRTDLDSFILSNFEFIGETAPITFYVEENIR